MSPFTRANRNLLMVLGCLLLNLYSHLQDGKFIFEQMFQLHGVYLRESTLASYLSVYSVLRRGTLTCACAYSLVFSLSINNGFGSVTDEQWCSVKKKQNKNTNTLKAWVLFLIGAVTRMMSDDPYLFEKEMWGGNEDFELFISYC